jgi:hypothetical protein
MCLFSQEISSLLSIQGRLSKSKVMVSIKKESNDNQYNLLGIIILIGSFLQVVFASYRQMM